MKCCRDDPSLEPTTTLREILKENREQEQRNTHYIQVFLEERHSLVKSFQKLVSFFHDSFTSSSQFSHLSFLTILSPALTINYVEHMLNAR